MLKYIRLSRKGMHFTIDYYERCFFASKVENRDIYLHDWYNKIAPAATNNKTSANTMQQISFAVLHSLCFSPGPFFSTSLITFSWIGILFSFDISYFPQCWMQHTVLMFAKHLDILSHFLLDFLLIFFCTSLAWLWPINGGWARGIFI